MLKKHKKILKYKKIRGAVAMKKEGGIVASKEEVEVGKTARVKITGIDEGTGKIQLSMKQV